MLDGLEGDQIWLLCTVPEKGQEWGPLSAQFKSLYTGSRPEVGSESEHGEKQLKSTKQLFFLQPYLLTLAVPLRRSPTPMPPSFMSFILLLEWARAMSRHAATHVYPVSTTSGPVRVLPVPSLGRGLPVVGRGRAPLQFSRGSHPLGLFCGSRGSTKLPSKVFPRGGLWLGALKFRL